MRTEEEMLSLIKDVAYHEENIRAAYMEGSRTNPNAPKDIFQDYDIVYVVTTTKPFREDREWIKTALCPIHKKPRTKDIGSKNPRKLNSSVLVQIFGGV